MNPGYLSESEVKADRGNPAATLNLVLFKTAVSQMQPAVTY